jgi:FixJ family two-component response regulator
MAQRFKSRTFVLTDKERVLVVDDDPAMLRGVARVLRKHGYEFLFATAEAFKNHNDFEEAACIILDINLNDGQASNLGSGSQPRTFPSPLST